MIGIKQIKDALDCVPCEGDKTYALEQMESAIESLRSALKSMDELTVTGRENLDSLLGCIMATEAIIGDKNDG